MKLTAEQLKDLGESLVRAAAIFNPAAAGGLSTVLTVAVELNAALKEIRDGNPAVWTQISSGYRDQLAAFDAAVPRPPVL